MLIELSDLLKNYGPYEKNSLKKKVVLVGRPNVGKSSIFNSLLNEDVAIVSQKAGTTRDVVRKVLPLSGFEVEIEDTAGLRPETNDEIEKSGMNLSVKAAALSPPPPSFSGLSVSAKTGEGIGLLLEKLNSLVSSSSGQKLISERTHKKLESAKKIVSKKASGLPKT